MSSGRRRLHRPLVALSAEGALIHVPANAVVTGLRSAPHRGFCEVLYDGRILRVPAAEFRDASTEYEPARRSTSR